MDKRGIHGKVKRDSLEPMLPAVPEVPLNHEHKRVSPCVKQHHLSQRLCHPQLDIPQQLQHLAEQANRQIPQAKLPPRIHHHSPSTLLNHHHKDNRHDKTN